ncbi:MAG: amino acid ABC transporter substrate-binding protein [bacterium]
MRRLLLAGVAAASMACGDGTHAAGESARASARGTLLSAVRARGTLKCGISQAAGFATPDDAGRWRGFDVDFCRALAVALWNDPDKVIFTPFTQQQRFSGLQSGEVDVLVNGTSMTSSRALRMGLRFGPIYLYDGQGFLVAKTLNASTPAMLDGAAVCVQPGTTTELTLADYARRNGIKFRPVVIEDLRSLVGAVSSGRCDVITQDGAGLATTRTMLPHPRDFVILPERFSKEPIAPVVRAGDDEWLAFVNWVFWSTMQAEEFGITQQNLAAHASSTDPAIRRFLGAEPGVTDGLGLDPQWTAHIIARLGNYGEIYERNLGASTALALPRGMNAPWNAGGLLYSPPFR